MTSYMKRFPKSSYQGNRDNFLIKTSRSKRVVHIGCTDWPNQLNQIKNDVLLHDKLIKEATLVLGVDVDKYGLDYMKKLDSNLILERGDISESKELREKIILFRPDLILVPDVLEHIENQRSFLKSLKEINEQSRSTICITTPNSFALKTFLPVLFGLDFTHEDHCLLHNEFTLQHVLKDAGFMNFKISYLSRSIKYRYGKLAEIISSPINRLTKIIPRLGDTLLVEIED